jgi:UTP-glucose-1-phosphate uridylyltransferase
VEAICIDRKVSGQDLQKKIDDLVAKGLLAKPQADLLHEERYIGNAALHEILPPVKQEIEDELVIVEGLMNTIYILPLRAERLREKRQKRTKT